MIPCTPKSSFKYACKNPRYVAVIQPFLAKHISIHIWRDFNETDIIWNIVI